MTGTTASVTQGVVSPNGAPLFSYPRGRVASEGEIVAIDGSTWTVPAANHFRDESFPFAHDLYNICSGHEFASARAALGALDASDIVEVDPDGEAFVAYVFGDNYFEMYVNGVAVGKDRVPFTPFNSSLVRFRASRPFTIAMKLVDWEEHLGVGCEENRGGAFHAGDGGMVAVIEDDQGETVAITDGTWKAQTYYTSPIKDLSCVREEGSRRLSEGCNTEDSNEGASDFGLHWKIPTGWTASDFDDSDWPPAVTYTNRTIGVDNKPAYTNFRGLFDDEANDALFIWSSNVVLDNEVLVRYTVQ